MKKYIVDSIIPDDDMVILLPVGDECNPSHITIKELPAGAREADTICAEIKYGMVVTSYIDHSATKVARKNVVSLKRDELK